MLTGIATAFAQQPSPNPMPLNPAVKHGTLPNGLNYYLLHNEEPKNRANFYIAQKVGSTLETPEQYGLAHFLEHMAFNGTTHFPGKTMLEYLQNKGIRFGSDINAYTAFDETVYNIDNVPCSDQALMDSVLLVLADWSNGILLEDAEIDAERGVIEEEWRSRDNASSRMQTAMLPVIYKEAPYQHMVIGTMDVVRNFPYSVIRDYYKRWYRPDQQGIVIVGDFDVDAMEKKVVELFSKIEMPEGAPERTYAEVSDNEKPIYFSFQDPETQASMAQIMFKKDKLPWEFRNTIEGFMQENVLLDVLCRMINNRLSEYSKNPECKYAYAGVSYGNFFVAPTKDMFSVYSVAKEDVKGALADAMAVVARACKTGFTTSELERVKSEVIAEYEQAYNQRNSTKTSTLAKQIIRNFISNTPAAGAEKDYQLIQQYMPTVPVQAYNQVASQILTPTNQVIIVQQPQTEGSVLPGEEVIVGTVAQALNAEYEAYEDVKLTEPLIAKFNKAGKVSSTVENKKFGTTEMTLSNGVKVVVKTTDFAADEVRMSAVRRAGKSTYSQAQGPTISLIEDIYNNAKLGAYDPIMLEKYLAGKKINLSYGIGSFTNTFNGKSAVKDLETMLELTYASFTAIGADEKGWEATMQQIRSILKQQDKDPMTIFQRNVTKAQYGNNALAVDPTYAILDKVSYKEGLDIIKASTANAAEYTFYFVGNVDAATLKPLLEKYIASLPAKKNPKAPKVITDMGFLHGDETLAWNQPMQNPASMIYDVQSEFGMEYNCVNEIYSSMVGQILSNVYTETIREEMGGAYSPYAHSYINPFTSSMHLISVIQTNAEAEKAVLDRAEQEIVKLLQNGAKEEQFRKVKEAAIKQHENSIRTNAYWLNNLMYVDNGFNIITGYEEALKATSLADFNAFMKKLNFKGNNRRVLMTGVAESK